MVIVYVSGFRQFIWLFKTFISMYVKLTFHNSKNVFYNMSSKSLNFHSEKNLIVHVIKDHF